MMWILTCCCEVLCSICIIQIEPRKHHAPDHADYAAPTLQRELDHTDHTDQDLPDLKDLDHDLSDVWTFDITRD